MDKLQALLLELKLSAELLNRHIPLLQLAQQLVHLLVYVRLLLAVSLPLITGPIIVVMLLLLPQETLQLLYFPLLAFQNFLQYLQSIVQVELVLDLATVLLASLLLATELSLYNFQLTVESLGFCSFLLQLVYAA